MPCWQPAARSEKRKPWKSSAKFPKNSATAFVGIRNSQQNLLYWQFGNRRSVLARVRRPIIYASRKIPQHRLTAANARRKRAQQLNLVSFCFQFVPRLLPEAVLHLHIAAAERPLSK